MEAILLVFVVAALVVLIILVLREKTTKEQSDPELSSLLRELSRLASNNQSRLEVLYEKVGLLERTHSSSTQQIFALNNGIAETGMATRSLIDTANHIREDLARAKTDLTELQTQARARQELERGTSESIKRLEAVIAGTQSKGSAGENILEIMFAKLPAEWQERNFTVGNKTVEFGLRLPNKLILPIDSKWAATNLLERFINCNDIVEQQGIKCEIEKEVLKKAKEVQKYIDPNLTVDFGVAVIPDAVYDLCCGILTDAFKLKVVLVSYSMFVPYLLLVIESTRKMALSIDEAKLKAFLDTAQASINAMSYEVEKRVSLAMTMLDNSRTRMRGHLGKLSGGLAGLGLIENVSTDTEALLELFDEESAQSGALDV
ncbi:MAG: DNA recombination protein RmuC [Pyrinomonadaceae bacterium]